MLTYHKISSITTFISRSCVAVRRGRGSGGRGRGVIGRLRGGGNGIFSLVLFRELESIQLERRLELHRELLGLDWRVLPPPLGFRGRRTKPHVAREASLLVVNQLREIVEIFEDLVGESDDPSSRGWSWGVWRLLSVVATILGGHDDLMELLAVRSITL